jgi:hypothetical protein
MIFSNRMSALLATASVGTLAPITARADDTIKHPGDHPQYSVEPEPHVLIGWASNYYYGSDDGFGLGGRVSINLTHNGFIEKINNSVALGLGLDWVHYSGPNCYYYYRRGPGCFAGVSADFFQFPIVMQWNHRHPDAAPRLARPAHLRRVVHALTSGLPPLRSVDLDTPEVGRCSSTSVSRPKCRPLAQVTSGAGCC